MYIPSHFEEKNTAVLHALMRAHPLGALVTVNVDGLEANHIPFVVHDGVLHGHVARANPIWRESRHGAVLVIFQGPENFISPSWYPSKAEDGKVVPTWNYAVVHAHGPLRIMDDRGWVRSHVEELTAAHESGRDTAWAITDAPPDYIESMIGGIVGLEITISRLEGKWKVSQNRSASDRVGVIEGLRAEGDAGAAMAELVRTGGKSSRR